MVRSKKSFRIFFYLETEVARRVTHYEVGRKYFFIYNFGKHTSRQSEKELNKNNRKKLHFC